MSWGFPVTVVLVAVACGNFGQAFWARLEWRCRPGMLRVCRAARAAASAAAAIASSDDDAVTWAVVMERAEWRQMAVKDSLVGGDQGVVPAAQRAGRAASLRSAAAALARTSCVPASQAQASEKGRMTLCSAARTG